MFVSSKFWDETCKSFREPLLFVLCIKFENKYILWQRQWKGSQIYYLEVDQDCKTPEYKGRKQKRNSNVLFSIREGAAATLSPWITPSPNPDLTSSMKIQRWTLHTAIKLRAAQPASTDRVMTQGSTAIDNSMKSNYTPGHKICVLLPQSAI